jgi:hypothetical protein
MDSIILRRELKKSIPDYKVGFDHYSIIWKNFNSAHPKQPESLVKRELNRMRHYKNYNIMTSGDYRGRQIYFAKSGGELSK